MADPDEQYDFGEVAVDASVHSAASATPEELADMADGIWARVRSSGVPAGDEKGNESLLRTLQQEFANFTHSFPIVIRWMVQAREYKRVAFLRFLRRHASRDLAARRDFLMLQADYLAELSREKGNPEHVTRQFRENVLKTLEEEDRTFDEMKAQADAEIKRRDSELSQERRAALQRYLLSERLAKKDAAPASGGGGGGAEAAEAGGAAPS